MAHDVNFKGKHLRLAAFLRVVDNGMPRRPSRFERHGRVVDEPNVSGNSDVAVDRAAVEISEDVQTTQNAAFPTTDQPHPDPPSARQTQKKERAIYTTKGKKRPRLQCRSPSIQKRRLPVNGLALQRTTTSDGLPNPSNASIVFAASATDLDPIEDSQTLLTSNTVRTSPWRPHPPNVSRQPRNKSVLIQVDQMGSVVKFRPESSLTIKHRIPLEPRHSHRTSNPRLGFASGFDGFVGSELSFVQKRKSRGRNKTASIVTKHTSTNGSLVLVNGLLPVPLLRTLMDQSQTSVKPTSSESARISSLASAPPSKLSASVRDYEQERYAYQSESAIRNQLSNITAPARHDSESSQSDLEAEAQWCTEAEEDLVNFDEDECVPSRFWTRTSTYVDDASYFGNAMQYLDETNVNTKASDRPR